MAELVAAPGPRTILAYAPLKPEFQRTTLPDALRGFALFGVVWSNYAFLSTWFFLTPETQAALPGAWFDGVLGPFYDILIDGRFYSIFSLLFGIGFGFFLDKVGLGVGGKVSMLGFEGIALAVFIIQILWSHWWLKRFQFGPMEWLWRSLTFGKVMVMRKDHVGSGGASSASVRTTRNRW